MLNVNIENLSVDYITPNGEHPLPLFSEWGKFVADRASVHLEQLWEWGEVRKADGWHPNLLVVREEGEILAGALILLRRVGKFFKVGYVMRGPLVKDFPGEAGGAVTRFVIDELKRASRRLGLVYLVVDLPYRAGQLPEELVTAGFTAHLPRLPPSGLMKGALLINLKQSEEELMQGFRRNLRRDIRLAEKGGVVIREGDACDIDLLWRLMNDLCGRRGTPPNVSNIEVVRRLWHALRPSNRVRIDIGEIAGKPVVALMTVIIGKWVIPWRIGWSGEGQKLSPEKLLYWSLLRTVRDSGFAIFDFNWVDPCEIEVIQAGESLPKSPNSGITLFKLGFGGEVVRLPGAFDYFPDPVVRIAVRFIGKGLLRSRLLSRVNRRRNDRPEDKRPCAI